MTKPKARKGNGRKDMKNKRSQKPTKATAAAARHRVTNNSNTNVSFASGAKVRFDKQQRQINEIGDSKRDTLVTYIKRVLIHRPNKIDESAIQANNLRPHPFVEIPSKLLLSPEEADDICNLPVRDKDISQAMHLRNPGRLIEGLTGNTLDVRSKDGQLKCRLIKGCVPEYLSLLFEVLLFIHKQVSVGWLKGCQADPLPVFRDIQGILRDKKIMKGYGLTGKNKITYIGLRNEDGNGSTSMVCQYQNKEGATKEFQFGKSFIDRQRWDRACLKRVIDAGHEPLLEDCEKLIDHCKSVYVEHAVDFLVDNQGFPRDQAEKLMQHVTLEWTTLRLDSHKSLMAIHHDAGCPAPAGVFGPGVQRLNKDGKWEKRCKGGKLFMANGLFEMEYGPLDCVLFDGNEPHGVSSLRALPSEGQKRAGDKWPMERFSLIIFCRFNRKPVQKHGRYDGTWNEAWRAEIEALASASQYM